MGYNEQVKPSDTLRFWAKVKDSGPCWIWTGARDTRGYGNFMVIVDGRKRYFKAHRIAFELVKGEIPEGMYVMHSCDNPSCVNPEHLSAGTAHDNHVDMMTRQRGTLGTKNAMAKLDDAAVREMRALHAAGGVTERALALRFGMSFQNVNRIIRREQWAHV